MSADCGAEDQFHKRGSARLSAPSMRALASLPPPVPLKNLLTVASAVCGIDWSGAKTAGKTIWVADGLLHPASKAGEPLELRLSAVRSAAELPGGATERAIATAALRSHLLALGRAHGHVWVGADVALALPLTLMRAGLADTALPRLYGAPRRSHEGDSARIHGRMRPPAHGLVSACENSTRRNYRPIVQC